MKWWKAGLKNFLVSTCITRRIRRRAIRDYQMVSAKILPTNSTIAPTNVRHMLILKGKDYW
jgi:hypothetical protein